MKLAIYMQMRAQCKKIYLGKNYYNNITTAIQKYDLWKIYIEQISFTRKAESTYDKSVGIHDKM